MESLVESSFDDQDVIPETPPEPKFKESRPLISKWRKQISDSEDDVSKTKRVPNYNKSLPFKIVLMQDRKFETEKGESFREIKSKAAKKRPQIVSDSEEVS